ncbi:S-adenosyl-L-methionine-dependent methyltransferase [Lophiostoma macrostomum CBS 122681]|uniref:S-adenosyl-L-methionine-dependent methyltransferase n=1 Tax=Lophiostoma macrostomum CBS 122681 TaxID=1314788 RepID=A0A6A6SRR3_9PLEO|nr:S-adenosyl-L-methionine-dependent methyltransferase [Lophiostoma macrostomum CBS 122681]
MNNPENNNTFKPKQALAPTPQLYGELVGNGMENLAKVTAAEMLPIPAGAVIHDNGCGIGAGTAAIVDLLGDAAITVTIHGTDINEQALDIYKKKADEHKWPTEATMVDSTALKFPDGHFSHSIGTALLFVLPDDGTTALKETYRTLKDGGIAAVNSWAYVPNMEPIQVAAKLTRPEGTPLPRKGMEKWETPEFLQSVVEKGGFSRDSITCVKRDVICVTTAGIDRYANMLWSFIGGTGAAGWLESDEEKWDEAIEIVKSGLKKTEGYEELPDGKLQLKFVANVVLATK